MKVWLGSEEKCRTQSLKSAEVLEEVVVRNLFSEWTTTSKFVLPEELRVYQGVLRMLAGALRTAWSRYAEVQRLKVVVRLARTIKDLLVDGINYRAIEC